MTGRRKKPAPFPGYKPLPDLDELFSVFGRALGDTITNALHSRPEPRVQILEVSIPEPMFKKLIMLCHPDKHNNSELSHEVTRWLIEQRNVPKL